MNILLRLTSMRMTDIYLLEKSGGKVVAGNWNSKYLLSITVNQGDPCPGLHFV